jgi:hypothetical protein
MWVKIVIGVVLVLALFAIFVATRSGDFRVERSITTAGSAAKAFASVNDFKLWPAWSPWEKVDPTMTRTYGPQTAGPGATYAWAGNNKIGAGRMTIERTVPTEEIQIKLEFLKPFAATNAARFTFTPTPAGQTRITWSMEGRQNFICKAVSLFMNMDNMIGAEFEKGLTALKGIAEQNEPVAAVN